MQRSIEVSKQIMVWLGERRTSDTKLIILGKKSYFFYQLAPIDAHCVSHGI